MDRNCLILRPLEILAIKTPTNGDQEIHQTQYENRPSIDPVTIVLTKGTSTETHTEEIGNIQSDTIGQGIKNLTVDR